MKFQLYVVNKQELNSQKFQKTHQNAKMQRDDKHISLVSQPGNFSKEQIEDLYISDEQELQRSIHLKQTSLLDEMALEQKNQLQIENKTKKEETKNE